jgi:hypothetical protein
VALEFCAILLKTCYNKTNPRINSLIFNALPTSLKRLIFNGFTHLNSAGGWVKGRVLSKG